MAERDPFWQPLSEEQLKAMLAAWVLPEDPPPEQAGPGNRTALEPPDPSTNDRGA